MVFIDIGMKPVSLPSNYHNYTYVHEQKQPNWNYYWDSKHLERNNLIGTTVEIVDILNGNLGATRLTYPILMNCLPHQSLYSCHYHPHDAIVEGHWSLCHHHHHPLVGQVLEQGSTPTGHPVQLCKIINWWPGILCQEACPVLHWWLRAGEVAISHVQRVNDSFNKNRAGLCQMWR